MAIELPLFPLNLVLFPGADLPLHIFEPRYRQMINECYEQQKPFGIALAYPDSEPLQEKPYSIGTMAEIEALMRLEDGRMNLIARGGEGFYILSQHRKKPHPSGMGEKYEERPEPEQTLPEQADKKRSLFGAHLEIFLEG